MYAIRMRICVALLCPSALSDIQSGLVSFLFGHYCTVEARQDYGLAALR